MDHKIYFKDLQDAQDQVGKRLKKFRTEVHDRTQFEFSSSLEYKQPAYQAIEKGGNSVTFKMIVALVNKYGLSIDWLLTGEGAMYLNDKSPANQEDMQSVSKSDLKIVETERDQYKKLWENAEDHIESYKSLLMEALRNK